MNDKNPTIKKIILKTTLWFLLALLGAFISSSVFKYDITKGWLLLLYVGMLFSIVGTVAGCLGILNIIKFSVKNNPTGGQDDNGKPRGVWSDLKNAFLQDLGNSLNMSNPLDVKGRLTCLTKNPEKQGEFYMRRGDDFSGSISTKTMLKILIPLVIIFAVGFLIYTFFFYTI